MSWGEAYETPSLRGSLGGVERLAQVYGVPTACGRAQLQGLLSYTLHKARRRPFPTLPVVVHGMDDEWVADLVEMQPLKKWNRGTRYLLTVVDVLSKYAWVEPLKDKTDVAVAAAFERPSKKAQRAFRAKLRGMVKRGKSVTLDTTLRRLVQALPQADHALKVWPKRSTLVSTVGRVPGSKRKLNTFQ